MKGFVITDGHGYVTHNQIEGWHMTVLLTAAAVWHHREQAVLELQGRFRGTGYRIVEVEVNRKGRALRPLAK
jgi:hypothetical protein